MIRKLNSVATIQRPRKPTLFSLFVSRTSPGLHKSMSHLSGTEKFAAVSKELGQRYRSMPSEEREKLLTEYNERVEDYERQREHYDHSRSPEQIIAEQKRYNLLRKLGKKPPKLVKDPKAPSRPLTSYGLFIQDVHNNPQLQQQIFGDHLRVLNLPFGEQAKALAAAYKQLDPAKKEQYAYQYKAKLETYKDQLKEYKEKNNIDQVAKQVVRFTRQSTTKKPAVKAARPKKVVKKVVKKAAGKKVAKIAGKKVVKKAAKTKPKKKIQVRKE